MTLMWRHRNRPGVPDRDVELAGPPFEGTTENYPPQGEGSVTVSTPAKSWTKEKIQGWAAENGFELDPDGTKDQWLEVIAAGPSETPSGAGETPAGATPEGAAQENSDTTNEVNPEEVTPNGEGNA